MQEVVGMRDSVAIAKYKPTDGALRMHYVGSGDEPVTAILRVGSRSPPALTSSTSRSRAGVGAWS